MKKIIFIDTRDGENGNFHEDRQAFYSKLVDEFKIPVTESISEKKSADIIFIHQGFFTDSDLMISNSERNPKVKNSIFVFYGNSPQEQISINTDKISYFNFYVLEENFIKFFDEIKQNGLKNSSWYILLGFDQELEDKLNRFATISPFEKGENLIAAKRELQRYVGEYLGGEN